MQSVQRYGRDTVLQLLSHIDTIETELKIAMEDEVRAVAAVDRLTDNVVQLQQELSEARNDRKIVVTAKVAEAIEHYRRRNVLTLYNLPQIELLAKAKNNNNEHAAVLAEHIFYRGYNEYFLAIINGYTVEEPINHEQRLRIELAKLITTWDGRSRYTLNKDINEALNDYFQETAK
jgi:GGDEF domain-containing protein